MEALLNIADWYASPAETFIRMYNMEKTPHLLLKFVTEKLVMQGGSIPHFDRVINKTT